MLRPPIRLETSALWPVDRAAPARNNPELTVNPGIPPRLKGLNRPKRLNLARSGTRVERRPGTHNFALFTCTLMCVNSSSDQGRAQVRLRSLALTVPVFVLLSQTAQAADAGGTWTLTLQCDYWNLWKTTTLVIPSGATGSFTATGKPLGSVSGQVRGNSISFNSWNFKAEGNFYGSKMAGTWRTGSGYCTWTGIRTGDSQAATAPKQKGASGKGASNEQDAQRALWKKRAEQYEREAKAILKNPDCSTLKRADYLIARASLDYKHLGNLKKNAELNAIGERISGEGGALDKCKAAKNRKPKRPPSGGASPSSNGRPPKPPPSEDLRKQCKIIKDELTKQTLNHQITMAQYLDQYKKSGCQGIK